jgi:hypothetical protein
MTAARVKPNNKVGELLLKFGAWSGRWGKKRLSTMGKHVSAR